MQGPMCKKSECEDTRSNASNERGVLQEELRNVTSCDTQATRSIAMRRVSLPNVLRGRLLSGVWCMVHGAWKASAKRRATLH